MSHAGRCLCGAVTFTAQGVATELHGCHCSMCRRWSGGSVLAAEVKSVAFEGAEHLRRYDSSEWAERGFCEYCGSNLFYRLKASDQYMMSMGAFDDQSEFRLVGEIFVDEKPPGYAFSGEHPRQTGAEFLASLEPG